jgi:hypothetical protein
MEESLNASMCSVVEEILKHVDGEEDSDAKTVEVVALLSSLACMVLALILNTFIIGTMVRTRKLKIFYFIIFLLLLLVQILYLCLVFLSLLVPMVPCILPSSAPMVSQVVRAASPVSRACLGIFASLVGASTVERFISSTSSSTLVRACTIIMAMLTAVSAPVLVVAFFLITNSHEEGNLHQEFWFGTEVCVYIILPLLILTIFGTVNCCKVSMTSRLLPSTQIQAIKLNIGVSVLTNISVLIFLVQESLHLWQSQLHARHGQDLHSAISYLGLAHNVCTIILCIMVTMASLLYCFICSTCCSSCCCPAINQLEQVRYTQVQKELR